MSKDKCPTDILIDDMCATMNSWLQSFHAAGMADEDFAHTILVMAGAILTDSLNSASKDPE